MGCPNLMADGKMRILFCPLRVADAHTLRGFPAPSAADPSIRKPVTVAHSFRCAFSLVHLCSIDGQLVVEARAESAKNTSTVELNRVHCTYELAMNDKAIALPSFASQANTYFNHPNDIRYSGLLFTTREVD